MNTEELQQRRDAHKSRLEASIQSIGQLQKNARTVIVLTTLTAFLLGFVAGASYWYMQGYPPTIQGEVRIEEAPPEPQTKA